jgi:hypothetical protein
LVDVLAFCDFFYEEESKMRDHFLRCTILMAAAFLTVGCPFGTAQVLPGVWLFDFGGGEVRPLELLADGTTNTMPNPTPPGVSGFFGGTLIWRQDGSTFVMAHELSGSVLLYSAAVDSSTSFSGVQYFADPNNDRPWTATRVE